MITFFYPNGSPINGPDYNPETGLVGYLPYFLSADDPDPAAKQIDKHYAHGGGWHPFEGFRYTPKALHYPGDPPMRLLAYATLRFEELRFYECSWLAIVQPDGSAEIARVD